MQIQISPIQIAIFHLKFQIPLKKKKNAKTNIGHLV